MITYNGIDLFSSGPSSIDPGPYESRDAIANAPGAIGASVMTQGVAPRQLIQRGTLVADDEDVLQVLIDAIQAHVGTTAHTLIDHQGKAWPDCLMQRIDTKPFTRLGPRITSDYEITYLQTHP